MQNRSVAVCSRSFSRNKILRTELLLKYENVKFNDKGISLEGSELIKFLSGYDKAIIALEKIDNSILSKLPDLKVISKYGVGLNNIDMNSLRKYKIRIGWKGGVNKRSVSELVLGFSINMLRQLNICNDFVKSGNFNQHIGRQLTGKTFGIIGCGNIGKDLVKLLQPFDAKLLVNDIINFDSFFKKYNVEYVKLSKLLTDSDIISLHVPLDNSTKNLLNKKNLSLLKKDAILINTARGGLIDENFLKDLLIKKKISGAAFDVYSIEPPKDYELLKLSNFFGTPHIGGSSIEAILAMGRSAIDGLDDNKFVS